MRPRQSRLKVWLLGELHIVTADDDGTNRNCVRWNTEVTEYTIELRKKVKTKVSSWARGLLS